MGLVRAGIWIPIWQNQVAALCTVRYVPYPVPCGGMTNAAGCASGAAQDALIRMARYLLATPENPQGRFKGLHHELYHTAFGANHGGWLTYGSPPGTWPDEDAIAKAIAFTNGRGPAR
jgi:hypothetical protein